MSHPLTAEALRGLLDYSVVSGRFYWKATGLRAGGDSGIYSRISVDGVRHYSHRLAFLWVTGTFSKYVDHVNLDKKFNAWVNLREASNAENAWNTRNRGTLKGVAFLLGKYRAQVRAGAKRHYGTMRNTTEEAYADACRLREELHGSFANHG
jgi:hypothetical protein